MRSFSFPNCVRAACLAPTRSKAFSKNESTSLTVGDEADAAIEVKNDKPDELIPFLLRDGED